MNRKLNWRDRLTTETTTFGTRTYGYDKVSNQTRYSDRNGQQRSYTYDQRNRLTQESCLDNRNRTNAGYETGDHNRLLNDGTYGYTYDNEGNRLTRTEIATGIVEGYQWDYRNRLTNITTTDSSGTVVKTADYTYDAYDRRIQKVVDEDGAGPEDAIAERYIYDGDHIALVFDGDGNLTHRYLHGPQIDQVLAEETADGEVRWALTDNQGTVRDVIDNQGNILNHITYDSFGGITSQSDGTAYFRFGYTGREFDRESGQY